MKSEKWIDVIGGIDPNLVENAEKASGNDSVSSRRARKFMGFKRVAIIAVAVILTVGGLLMLNANVRAAVVGYFLNWEDDENVRVHWNVESAEGDPADADVDIHDVAFGYLPEGYVAHDIPEYPDQEGFDPRIRTVRLMPAECEGMTEGELSSVPDQLMVHINRAEDIDWGYGNGSYDLVYMSTINGMDAFMIREVYEYEGKHYEVGDILFSDGKITVSIGGVWEPGFDEMVKVAEGMTW